MKLKIGDFVINTFLLKKPELVVNSVGVIKNVLPNNFFEVFFIGKKLKIEIDKQYLRFIDPYSLTKESDYKICNVCHVLKPMEEFQINQTDALGRKTRRPSCNACREIIDGAQMSTDERKRMERLRPIGVYTCPICGKTSIVDATAKFVIDHDHKTGKARTWICDSCNTGLGRFQDNIEVMENAIKYLTSFDKQNS